MVVVRRTAAEPTMDLNDKAEQADEETYSIEDAADAGTGFRITSMELEPAENVGTEQYPRFGDWLPVERTIDGAAAGTCYVECPGGLARALLDAAVAVGDVFYVDEVAKDRDGQWTVTIEVGDG